METVYVFTNGQYTNIDFEGFEEVEERIADILDIAERVMEIE